MSGIGLGGDEMTNFSEPVTHQFLALTRIPFPRPSTVHRPVQASVTTPVTGSKNHLCQTAFRMSLIPLRDFPLAQVAQVARAKS